MTGIKLLGGRLGAAWALQAVLLAASLSGTLGVTPACC